MLWYNFLKNVPIFIILFLFVVERSQAQGNTVVKNFTIRLREIYLCVLLTFWALTLVKIGRQSRNFSISLGYAGLLSILKIIIVSYMHFFYWSTSKIYVLYIISYCFIKRLQIVSKFGYVFNEENIALQAKNSHCIMSSFCTDT